MGQVMDGNDMRWWSDEKTTTTKATARSREIWDLFQELFNAAMSARFLKRVMVTRIRIISTMASWWLRDTVFYCFNFFSFFLFFFLAYVSLFSFFYCFNKKPMKIEEDGGGSLVRLWYHIWCGRKWFRVLWLETLVDLERAKLVFS